MSASFKELRELMTNAARITFSAYQREHADENFYTIALYTDSDAGGANCAANTEH